MSTASGSSPLRVIVVGGGIGGFTTALALARRGISVDVLERAPEFKEIGAGLQVGPNAGRLLRELGVFDAVLGRAVLPSRFVIIDVYSGNELHSADFTGLTERYGAPYTVMHRHDLLTALMDAAAETGLVRATPGKEVIGVDQDGQRATVWCADGTTYEADVLLGADGLNSVVRRQVLDVAPPLTSDYVIYRGPGPRPEGIEDAVMLYTGDGMHMMQYPMAGGDMINRVVSFRSTRGAPGSEEWGTPAELFERFASACEPVREALKSLDLETRWVQYDREPQAGWAQGRIALLGDAAHPMRQYLAQGAGQAMEDAVVLASVLAENGDDVHTALKSYEEQRYPRATAVQVNTRFFGEFTHLGGVEAVVRNRLLDLLGDEHEFVEWLWGDGTVAPPMPPASVQLY